MKSLPSIPLRRDELPVRLRAVHPGMRVAEVRQALGGKEFTSRTEPTRTIRLWRFEILDAATPLDRYELVQGDFDGGRLLQLMTVPRG